METVQIAVIGEVNRGKTALVNAMLNRPGFLSESPLPNTIEVTNLGGMTIEPSLNRQVFLWDTPGLGAALPIGERRQRETAIAHVLQQSHAAIGVFLADPLPDGVLFEMVRRALPYVRRWLFVLNDKGNRLLDNSNQLSAIVGYIEDRLQTVGIEAPIVVRANVHAPEGMAEFWPQFEALIGDLLRDSRALHEINAHKVKAHAAALAQRQAKADVARKAFVNELERIRTDALAVLVNLWQSILAELKWHVENTEPQALVGQYGSDLMLGALRRERDHLASYIETDIGEGLAQLRQALSAAELSVDTLPNIPELTLPDPINRVIAVRVGERGRFGNVQIDPAQTREAYRSAVAHAADAYAAQLAPLVESALDKLQESVLSEK